MMQILTNATPESIASTLKARIYNANGNIHRFAVWADEHEGNIHTWLSGRVNMRLTTLVHLHTLITAYEKRDQS